LNQLQGFNCHSIIDERSAGFIALGMAQASGKPVALLCTSGTALLNYYPAITEAYYTNTPLLVLSADRPEEWIDQWEGQCIRQQNVFSNHILDFQQAPSDLKDVDTYYLQVVELLSKATGRDGGPVHFNIPFREPFYFEHWNPNLNYIIPRIEDVSVKEQSTDISEYIEDISNSFKTLVFGGYGAEDIGEIKAPIFYDMLAEKPHNSYTGKWDAYLTRNSNPSQDLVPDLLITFGKFTISKGLKKFLRSASDLKHLHISKSEDIGDPFLSNPIHIPMEPKAFFELVANELSITTANYLTAWQDELDQYEKDFSSLNWLQDFNEFSAMKWLLTQIQGKVHLGNSMPVRYASFLADYHNKTYGCNRGTSGIDGCLSTAIGSASISNEKEYLFIGDISFFYDANGLWNSLNPDLTIFVMNNQGGRIFQLIDGPEKMGDSIQFQTTPHRRSAKGVALDHGIAYQSVSNFEELQTTMYSSQHQNGLRIVEIFTDPSTNADFYRKFKNL